MTVAKFWDGTAWLRVTSTPGPQGPIGPQGPQGVPGELVTANFPVWRKNAVTGGTRTGIVAAVEMYDAVNRDMRLGPITPTRNVWMEAYVRTLFLPTDAAWVRADAQVHLMANNTDDSNKVDADGAASVGSQVQYWTSGAGPYVPVFAGGPFKLIAGQTYWVRPYIARSTGTWAYYLGGYLLHWAKIVGFW